MTYEPDIDNSVVFDQGKANMFLYAPFCVVDFYSDVVW